MESFFDNLNPLFIVCYDTYIEKFMLNNYESKQPFTYSSQNIPFNVKKYLFFLF